MSRIGDAVSVGSGSRLRVRLTPGTSYLYDSLVLTRMLNYIRRHGLMRPGDRVGVAVSGGADSVALLRLLLEARAELGIVLAVVHFNHRIRGAEADADERFVGELAAQFDLEFFSDSADAPAYAAEHKLSLEAAARELRYGYFWRLLVAEGAAAGDGRHGSSNLGHTARSPGASAGADQPGKLMRVATAHTRDDQAETVLLRLLRGAWTRGLSGIHPAMGEGMRTHPDQQPEPRILRPLLEVPRADLRACLESLHQPWREDATNADLGFVRNRVRHELLPLLKRDYNPAVDQVLSETAEIARAEEEHWEFAIMRPYFDMIAPVREHAERICAGKPVRIALGPLRDQPLALRRRVLRRLVAGLGPALDFQATQALVAFAADAGAVGKTLELAGGWVLTRSRQELTLSRRCPTKEAQDYDLALPVGGEVELPPAGMTITAAISTNGERLDPAYARDLRVRNWHPGDRYWPAHTAAPKKLKELLQARHIPKEQKARWPVVTVPLSPARASELHVPLDAEGEAIVWVPGFRVPEQFRVREDGTEGVRLTQVPLRREERSGS